MTSVKGSGRTPGKKRRTKYVSSKCNKENESRLSIIVSVMQNENTIGNVLREAVRLKPKEIIVILNGSTDRSLDIVMSCSSYHINCFMYPFPLGQDVWRVIGAKEASGEVLLFLNGDNVILAKELRPFIQVCYEGVDIALRKTTPSGPLSTTQLATTYVNSYLERTDLGFSSMMELPFAMTKEAAASIGVNYLLVPPLAFVIAIEKGLRVEESHYIKVTTGTKKTKVLSAKSKRLDRTRLGDHLEALAYLHEKWAEGL